MSEISARLANPGWPTNEIARLKAVNRDFDDGQWLSNDLILLENGEWLSFENICRKENRKIHDLFLARASDGHRYYSTYHFCRNMVALRIRMEFQPKDLASFIKEFHLRRFDGKSDECLNPTWPPKYR